MNKLQTGLWVDTERTFQQVIDTFADVDVKPRVAVLQLYLMKSINKFRQIFILLCLHESFITSFTSHFNLTFYSDKVLSFERISLSTSTGTFLIKKYSPVFSNRSTLVLSVGVRFTKT